MKITHYLYNAFVIEETDVKVAIDPGQNLWLFKLGSLIPREQWDSVTHIVITHGDPDHHWQSDRMAKASRAPVVCGKSLTKTENGQTLLIDPRGRALTSWVAFENVHPLEVGDSVQLDGVNFEAVRSVHGPISIPILWWKISEQPGEGERVGLGSMGFRISINGKTIVNLGDSLLLEEWSGMRPDVLMLPIGGMGDNTWTMDVRDALEAVKLIEPGMVIPCHYSVPFLWKKQFARADGNLFKREVENLGFECTLMGYGDEVSL